jgi:hypothetical protein
MGLGNAEKFIQVERRYPREVNAARAVQARELSVAAGLLRMIRPTSSDKARAAATVVEKILTRTRG